MDEPVLVLELPGLPSLNPAARRDRWSVWREKRRWQVEVWAGALESGFVRPSQPLCSAHVVLTRRSTREPDYDNLVSSFKYLIDALQPPSKRLDQANSGGILGVIRDDSPRTITAEYLWTRSERGESGVRIEVWSGSRPFPMERRP